MAHGKLQCCGSPLFLKNKFGVGYTLTVVKQQHDGPHGAEGGAAEAPGAVTASLVERSKQLLALVRHFVEEAEPLSDVGAEQSFRLPFAASGKFVELFTAFDQEKEALGIAEYGISVTTLEEVFIKVGEMEDSINELTEAEAEAKEIAAEEAAAAGNSVPSSTTANPVLNSAPASADHDESPPLHGILHHDHHHHTRGRGRSVSSETPLHPRSSVTSVDHHHVPHKRVSFRDGGEDERTSLGSIHAMTHPTFIKGAVYFFVYLSIILSHY
jgi:hypothetical protein